MEITDNYIYFTPTTTKPDVEYKAHRMNLSTGDLEYQYSMPPKWVLNNPQNTNIFLDGETVENTTEYKTAKRILRLQKYQSGKETN